MFGNQPEAVVEFNSENGARLLLDAKYERRYRFERIVTSAKRSCRLEASSLILRRRNGAISIWACLKT